MQPLHTSRPWLKHLLLPEHYIWLLLYDCPSFECNNLLISLSSLNNFPPSLVRTGKSLSTSWCRLKNYLPGLYLWPWSPALQPDPDPLALNRGSYPAWPHTHVMTIHVYTPIKWLHFVIGLFIEWKCCLMIVATLIARRILSCLLIQRVTQDMCHS